MMSINVVKLINVDFDGVIIPNDFEKKFLDKGLREANKTRISQFDGRLFDWYLELVDTAPVAPLNIPLLKQLSELKGKYAIRLWTNRNIELRRKTITNLAEWAGVFDSFHFYNGTKSRSKVEGIAIDNSPANLACAEYGGILYEWR